MKKTFLSAFLILALCSVSAYAASTNSTTKPTTRPSSEKMGPPPQDGDFANRPAPPSGDLRRPNKRPDSKPGGDRVPPEFQSSNTSSSNTNSK